MDLVRAPSLCSSLVPHWVDFCSGGMSMKTGNVDEVSGSSFPTFYLPITGRSEASSSRAWLYPTHHTLPFVCPQTAQAAEATSPKSEIFHQRFICRGAASQVEAAQSIAEAAAACVIRIEGEHRLKSPTPHRQVFWSMQVIGRSTRQITNGLTHF